MINVRTKCGCSVYFYLLKLSTNSHTWKQQQVIAVLYVHAFASPSVQGKMLVQLWVVYILFREKKICIVKIYRCIFFFFFLFGAHQTLL